ncbi:MAG: hypothetical protein IT426_20990 [Pirellulales bacterium]|nr:hypothetical protein [Pirellulales bacterium]
MTTQAFLFHPHREEVVHLPRQTAPFVEGSETSKAAAERTRDGVSGEIRKRVYRFIADQGQFGATDHEVAAGLGLPGDSTRPRRIELVRMGLVRDSGMCRQTRSGREATVWKIARITT